MNDHEPNMNDYVLAMFSLGCTRMTFALDDKSQPAVLVDQRVNTPDGMTVVQHQCVGTSHIAAAQSAMEKAQHCARLKPLAVTTN